MKKQQPPTPPPAPGEIRSDSVYPLAEFRRRVGVCHKGIRTMREAGLKVRYVGRMGFVHGSDFAEFVAGLETSRGQEGGGA